MTAQRTLSQRIARRYPFLPLRGRLRWINGSLEEIPSGEVVSTRAGIRVRVLPDGMYRNVYFWGDYEPYQTKVYLRIVRPGDIVLDVGTNFGWFAVAFARRVGASGRVHAFEPVPFIQDLAAETLELNGVGEQVILNRFGLGRTESTLPVFTYAGLPHGHATLANLGRADATAHECRFRRLDDYCAEHGLGAFPFMKVDVEGSELDVFLGGERTLSRGDAPVIAFELNRECLAARGVDAAAVIAALNELGYTHFFTLSIRRGIRRLERRDLDGADCLAAKPARLRDLRHALRTGRLLR
jgi:FkbM family methyltransferase